LKGKKGGFHNKRKNERGRNIERKGAPGRQSLSLRIGFQSGENSRMESAREKLVGVPEDLGY